jgi:hypothetical protein
MDITNSSGVGTVDVNLGNNTAPNVTLGGPPINQIIELATGNAPSSGQLANWQAYEDAGGSLSSIASAFIASTAFANLHNGGVPVDPNSPIATAVVSSIIDQTQGAHTASQVSAWVGSGLSTVQVFQAFAAGDQFTAATAQENAPNVEIIATGMPHVGSGNIGGGIVLDKLSIVFDNAATEILAHPAASNQVDVSSATMLQYAWDMAVASAVASQSGDVIPANTGVIDWFQYDGNTYVVETTNPTSSPETQTTLTDADTYVAITGSVDFSSAQLSGHVLSVYTTL